MVHFSQCPACPVIKTGRKQQQLGKGGSPSPGASSSPDAENKLDDERRRKLLGCGGPWRGLRVCLMESFKGVKK